MALSVNSSKNGGRDGIQHVALRVDNIENAIADLMAKGVRMIDENLVTVQAVPPLLLTSKSNRRRIA